MPQEQQAVDSIAFIGEQSAIDTKVALIADMSHFIYECVNLGLVARGAGITPGRMGSASQSRNIRGKYAVGGPIQLFFHVGGLGLLLKHAAMGSVTTTVYEAQQELKAVGAFSDGVAFSLDTQPTATDPGINPCRLEFNWSGLTGDISNVVIVGTDNLDTAITETITVDGQPSTTLSTKYYKTVNASGITVNMASGAGSVQIDGDMNLYKHVIALGTKPLNGLTAEIVKGDTPNTYWNLVPNVATISMTDGEGMQGTFDLLGTHFALGQNIAGGTVASDPSGWTESGRMPAEIFGDWSTFVTFDAQTLEVVSATINFNNNLFQPPRNRGVRNPAYPKRNGQSEITYVFTVPYVDPVATSTPDFDQIADDDTDKVVKQTNVWQVGNGGQEFQFVVDIPRGQLMDISDPVVNVGGDLVREVTVRPLRTAGQTTRDEIKFTLINNYSDLEGVVSV